MTLGIDPSPLGATDAGADRDQSDRHTRCLKRLTWGHGWCHLDDGHEGQCYGTVSERPEAGTFMPRVRSSWGDR